MDPNNIKPDDKTSKNSIDSIYPPVPQTPTIITGSELESMQRSQEYISIQKKLKLSVGAVLIVAIAITVFSIFNFFIASSDQNQNEEPSSPVITQSSVEENNSKQNIVVEKYKDVRFSMKANTFKLKYFTDAEYLGACQPDVIKPCEGLYTNDGGRSKAFLTISPVDSRDAADICTGQEKPSFSFTGSDGNVKQACETGIEGRILYYNALLSLGGKDYQVVFKGESRMRVAYSDMSVYKKDLEAIFPTITLAL